MPLLISIVEGEIKRNFASERTLINVHLAFEKEAQRFNQILMLLGTLRGNLFITPSLRDITLTL